LRVVHRLKRKLHKAGLDATGKKSELIERLFKYQNEVDSSDESDEHEENADKEENDSDDVEILSASSPKRLHEELSKMPVRSLQVLLRRSGLKQRGSKVELVKRLVDHHGTPETVTDIESEIQKDDGKKRAREKVDPVEYHPQKRHKRANSRLQDKVATEEQNGSLHKVFEEMLELAQNAKTMVENRLSDFERLQTKLPILGDFIRDMMELESGKKTKTQEELPPLSLTPKYSITSITNTTPEEKTLIPSVAILSTVQTQAQDGTSAGEGKKVVAPKQMPSVQSNDAEASTTDNNTKSAGIVLTPKTTLMTQDPTEPFIGTNYNSSNVPPAILK